MNLAKIKNKTKDSLFHIAITALLMALLSVLGYVGVTQNAANKQFRDEMIKYEQDYVLAIERLTRQEERTKATMDVLIRHENNISVNEDQIEKNKDAIAIMPYLNTCVGNYTDIKYKLYKNPLLCQLLIK